MRLIIMSDIHGNLEALNAVLSYARKNYKIDKSVILGDIIDYGMHSNEVIQCIQKLDFPIICNIWGNHERAIMLDDYTRFSTERGSECARYTKSILTMEARKYILEQMNSSGRCEFDYDGKKYLAVHGSLEDNFWKSVNLEGPLEEYRKYDYVFCGHSHISFMYEKYYEVDSLKYRNKKKVVFINPGSVGQPRNLCNLSQFAIFDTESGSVFLEKIPYDIKKEQRDFSGNVDLFYRDRLELGI